VTDTTLDPVLTKYREELTGLDAELISTLNKRLVAVEKLRRYKSEQGIPFRDPAREQWMLQYLTRCNEGPLSEPGLARLYEFVLELVKQETDG
jgi:chorismate mutase